VGVAVAVAAHPAIGDGIGQLETAPARARDEIGAHVEALWATTELRERSPTVADEVSGGLHSIGVLAAALVDVDRDLREAFAKVFGRALEAPLPLGVPPDAAAPSAASRWGAP